jgi:hypothetical protein
MVHALDEVLGGPTPSQRPRSGVEMREATNDRAAALTAHAVERLGH